MRIDIGTGTAKALFLPNNFFWILHFKTLSCDWLFGISITLLQSLISLCNFLFTQPEASIGTLEKKATSNFGSASPLMFRKNSGFEHFWKLSSKTSMVESFLSVLAGLPWSFPKTCLEQLLWREPIRAYFYNEKLHTRRYLRNFPEV